MTVLTGSTSLFSAKAESGVLAPNYFRLGSEGLLHNPSLRLEPILDEKFARAIVAKVLPSLNARL